MDSRPAQVGRCVSGLPVHVSSRCLIGFGRLRASLDHLPRTEMMECVADRNPSASIDRAALIGAVLAAVLATTQGEGSYDLLDTATGITLTLFVVSYCQRRARSGERRARIESLTIASVAAMCITLIPAIAIQDPRYLAALWFITSAVGYIWFSSHNFRNLIRGCVSRVAAIRTSAFRWVRERTVRPGDLSPEAENQPTVDRSDEAPSRAT
jgi:hypothetical protein